MEDEIKKYDLRWQALRYAVDQIDLAWSYESHEYRGDEYNQKKSEMTLHRNTLCELQNVVLHAKRILEEAKQI